MDFSLILSAGCSVPQSTFGELSLCFSSLLLLLTFWIIFSAPKGLYLPQHNWGAEAPCKHDASPPLMGASGVCAARGARLLAVVLPRRTSFFVLVQPRPELPRVLEWKQQFFLQTPGFGDAGVRGPAVWCPDTVLPRVACAQPLRKLVFSFHLSLRPRHCTGRGRADGELHELGSSTCTALRPQTRYLLLELAGNCGPKNIFKFSTPGKSLLFVSFSDVV